MAAHRARSAAWSRSRRVIGAIAITASLVLAVAVPATAVASTSTVSWHRLNVHSDPPEHERFACRVMGDVWRCGYDKVPDPTLGLAWDQTRGTFVGEDTTGDFSCPDWFPADACDSADLVVTGVASFTFPRASGGFEVDQQLLVGDDGGLWIYWVGQFVCPWYPTFEDALANAADSFCAFAP
jgi:hypothetical protein